jgi:uncharacterized protein
MKHPTTTAVPFPTLNANGLPAANGLPVAKSSPVARRQPRRYPIDLGERMAVCDGNYIRILKLLRNLQPYARREFLLPQPGSDGAQQRVVVAVVESFKYTSTVSITIDPAQPVPALYHPPAMFVRLYHDANTAEVVSYQDERDIRVLYDTDELPRYYPDEKEQVNRFLADWLNLCLDAGISRASDGSDSLQGLIPYA